MARAAVKPAARLCPAESGHVVPAGPFGLDRGESIEQPIEWEMPWAEDNQQVEFYLFAGGQETEEPYRLLRLWLDVVDDSSSTTLSCVD